MKNIIKVFSLFLLIGLWGACGEPASDEVKMASTAPATPKYAITTVKNDTLEYEINLPGNLKPYEQVVLYSKVEGFVTNLRVDRGDYVRKGQLLMKIDAPEIQQQVLAARAKLQELMEGFHFSKTNYQRIKEAASIEGVVSAVRLQEAKTQYMADSAALQYGKAQVQTASQLLAYTHITAPFNGVITDRYVSPGALVGSGTKPLVQINREDKLRLTVSVPAQHARALNPETKATFTVNSFPGTEFQVQLSRSSHALDPELRSMKVEFDYDNAQGLLNGGDYASVNLKLKREQGTLQVPSTSIIRTQSDIYIAKVVDSRVELVPVVTGLTIDGNIEVFGNIQAGDTVILKGNSTLESGMEIELIEN